MSAVMSTFSIISGARRAKKPPKNSLNRKSGQFSDAGEDRIPRNSTIERRSTSMQTLEGAGDNASHLENLEAKMANIEVSLSSTGRRRRVSGSVTSASGNNNKNVSRDLDSLRNALREKDQLIQSLKEQLCTTLSINRMAATLTDDRNGGPPAACVLSPDERRTLEDRSNTARQKVCEKQQAIAALKLALDSLHVTDNIDSRIQQAELEYALGREELELLTLMEQSKALQALLDQADAANAAKHRQTLFGCIKETNYRSCSIHAVELDMDPNSPRFNTSLRKNGSGFKVDWAMENSGLLAGDRILEIDGKQVWTCRSSSELPRLYGLIQIVVLRTIDGDNPMKHHIERDQHPTSAALAQVITLRSELDSLRQKSLDSQKTKDSLRADNLRLTHRISYLEEQVSELLAKERTQEKETNVPRSEEKKLKTTVNKTIRNITNINITAESTDVKQTDSSKQTQPDVQVFQKGPDITALVANLPGLNAGGKNTSETSANLPIVRPKTNYLSTHIAINSPRPSRSRSIASVDASDETDKAKRLHQQINDNNHQLQHSKSSHSLNNKEREKYESMSDRKGYKMRQSLSHHCIPSKDYKYVDYQSETAAALKIIKENQKHYLTNIEKCHSNKRDEYNKRDKHWERNSNIDFYDDKSFCEPHNKSTDNISDTSGKKVNWAEKKTLSIIEQLKQSQRLRKSKSHNKSVENIDFTNERDYMCDRIDGKVLENAHKSRRHLKHNLKGGKVSDLESENSDYPGNRYHKTLDYTSEPGAVKIGHYLKQSQSLLNGLDGKTRPTPPKKPLRLSLHKAQSSHAVNSEKNMPDILDNNSCNNDIYRKYQKLNKTDSDILSLDDDLRKPSKRNHKGDRFTSETTKIPSSREKLNQLFNRSGHVTPKPTRKFQDNIYPSYDTPGADDVYPDTPKVIHHDKSSKLNGNALRYSPRTPTRTDSMSSRTPSRAESNHSSSLKWPIQNKSPENTYKSKGHIIDKWN